MRDFSSRRQPRSAPPPLVALGPRDERSRDLAGCMSSNLSHRSTPQVPRGAVPTLSFLRGLAARLNSLMRLSGTVFLFMALPAIWAQSSDALAEDGGLIITTESNLVVVPLHVYRKKTSVGGLGKEDFELLENGASREIAFVEGPPGVGESPAGRRTVPVEIVFLLDVSHSTVRPGLIDVDAIQDSLLGGLGENVSVSVYGFARRLTRFTEPTKNIARIQHALDLAYAAEDGQTKVFESILETARDAASRGGNVSRMMVVFSDGLSTTDFSPEWTARAAIAFGIPIYPVVLGHQRIIERASRSGASAGSRRNRRSGGWHAPSPRPSARPRGASRAREQELRQKNFADLGQKTGGRSYDLIFNSSKAIRTILESLATLAKTEYVVGYYPLRSVGEPVAREVEVRLRDKRTGTLYGGRRVIVH